MVSTAHHHNVVVNTLPSAFFFFLFITIITVAPIENTPESARRRRRWQRLNKSDLGVETDERTQIKSFSILLQVSGHIGVLHERREATLPKWQINEPWHGRANEEVIDSFVGV